MSTNVDAREDATPEPWTVEGIAARLADCRQNGALVLSRAALASPEVEDLLGALGLSELELDDARLDRTAESVTVVGTATLFDVPAVDNRATFGVVDGALTVELASAFPPEARLRILGLPWASLGDLSLAMHVTGPSLAVPVVSAALSATVQIEGQRHPIRVTLTSSSGGGDWVLRATDIPLPDLSSLTHVLAGQDARVLAPPKLGELDGLSIEELSCVFDPADWTVRSLAATVGAPGKKWEPAPGFATFRDVSLSVALEFGWAEEGVDASTGHGRDGGSARAAGVVKSVAASVNATVELAGLELPVRVARESDGQWRMGIHGAHGFPPLGEIVAAAADADTAAMLPSALGKLRVDSASLELTLASGEPTLRSVFLSTRLADDWPIVENHLALERVALEVLVDRAGGDASGFLTGAIRLEGFELPVTVEKPPGGAPWTLKLGSDATPTLSGLSSLGALAGGDDMAGHLPAGFGEGALTLSDLAISFDPATHAVSAVDIALHSAGPWSLPELSQFDVRDLRLELHVAWPGDSGRREVTGTIGGTVDLAGPAITLTAAKPTSAAPWEFKGTLRPPPEESTLALGALVEGLATKIGVVELPAALREATLSKADVTFDTSGGFSFDCNAHLPVDGSQLGLDLTIVVKREADGFHATYGGRTTIAGLHFDLVVSSDPAETRLVAAYSHDEDLRPIAVSHLLAAVGVDIPDTLTVDLEELVLAIATDTAGTRALFALDVGDIDLSALPLVGAELGDAAKVEDLRVVAATAAPAAPKLPDVGDIAAWNELLKKTRAKPLPVQGIDRGVSVSAVMALGSTSERITLPAAASPAQNGAGAIAPAGDDTKWFPVQRSFGPVHLGRVGARYDAGVLWLLLDASLSLGGLSIALNGLSVGSPLHEFDPKFHLDGLGLTFRQDPVEIAGAFLAVPGKDLGNASFQYDGAAVVRAEAFTLAAVGSYAEVAGQPSLFVFAELDKALGGPPAAYVTGLMGGFGYNRALRIPEQEEISQFPFLQGLGGASPGDGTPLGVLAVLEGRPTQPSTQATQRSTPATEPATKPWLTVAPGESWLAVGLTFTSFQVAETHALLIAEFGHELQFALVGLTKLRLPRDMPAKPFAYVELQFEAVLKPQEGFFGLSAQLSPNSFLFAPECRLTGGFAFYVWFDGDHAGDFVLTIGGYHPAFTPKPWYPQEPRLGLRWPVNDLVTIDGEAYFALTPSCIMGGGGLHVLFHDGNLQAWLKASANFLISWAPFRYSVDIGVSVGVSYRLDWGLIQKTFSAELGAQLSLWGPPTGGTAYVSWWVISFSIEFGAGRPTELTLKGWNDFKPMLPAEADLCKVVIQSGLLPGAADRDDGAGASENAVVRADALQVATECAVPATQLKLATKADAFATPKKQAPAIRPLGLAEIDSQHTLHVRDSRGHEIDLKQDEWTIEARTRNVPEALWGAPLKPKENPPPSANLVQDQLVGFTIKPPRPHTGPIRGAVSMGTALEAVPVGTGVLPPTSTSTPAPGAPAKGAVKAIEAVADAADARAAIRTALGRQYLDPVPDDRLDAFAAGAAALFPVAPMLSGPAA